MRYPKAARFFGRTKGALRDNKSLNG